MKNRHTNKCRIQDREKVLVPIQISSAFAFYSNFILSVLFRLVLSLPFDSTTVHWFYVGFDSGFDCWLIKHTDTIVIKEDIGTFFTAAKWNCLLSKAQQQKEPPITKIYWETATLTVDFIKPSGPTAADALFSQIITDCGNVSEHQWN